MIATHLSRPFFCSFVSSIFFSVLSSLLLSLLELRIYYLPTFLFLSQPLISLSSFIICCASARAFILLTPNLSGLSMEKKRGKRRVAFHKCVIVKKQIVQLHKNFRTTYSMNANPKFIS